jgi:hypothetical protein
MNIRHVRQVVKRREVRDVRVVDVAALVADDGEELLVRVLVDQRGVDHHEGVFVRSQRSGVIRRIVDDKYLRHRDLEGVRRSPGDPVNFRKLSLAHLDGMAQELMTADLLEEADTRLDRQRDRLGAVEGDPRLPVERVRVFVSGRICAAAGALLAFAGDEGFEVK